MNRLMSRLSEFQRSEDTFVDNMHALQGSLTTLIQDPRWAVGTQQIAVINRALVCVENNLEVESMSLISLHSRLAVSLRKIEYAAEHDPSRAIRGLRDIFQTCLHPAQPLGNEFVRIHAEFEVVCGQVIYHLHKKAGGQVKGDRAVGTLTKAEGSLASALADLQSLLVLPSQSVVRFALFLDEMVKEVRSPDEDASPQSDMLLALEARRHPKL
jgi:hypothetical protein